jgi:acetoacetyl-CoA synthetase
VTSSEKLWQPSPQRAQASQMHVFLRAVAARHGIASEWESLRKWSLDHSDRFWEELLHFVGVAPSAPARTIRSGAGMLGTRWFEGMRVNYARHMLGAVGSRGQGAGAPAARDDDDAILFENELGQSRRLARGELRAAVAGCAAALRADGVRPGDRVAGYMPNVPETIVAMLATASIGAVWSSCSPDFGVQAVVDRFGQIEPKVLFTTDGYSYGGKRFVLADRIRDLVERVPSVRRVVVVPYIAAGGETESSSSATAGACAPPRGVSWAAFLASASSATPEPAFEEVAFDHPLFIMYSSGTTGVPKCIVHGHGGTLLQHLKELMLHTDLRAGERVFFFTTCGWMMWNWLASGLGAGAAIVLYDGNPAHPSADRLWEMAERLRINVFGTSPKFLAACQKAAIVPGRRDLSALRCICSTGSPLSEDLFRWTYQNVKRDLQLSSISGGTDIISCFMLGNPLLPVYAGEIQCRGLGMDVQAWDERANSVLNQKGELVCVRPFPSQPVGFWNDPEGRKYRAAYFDFYERAPAGVELPVWRHGDFIEIRDSGGVVVYGRSDATLNPGGVRIGTAEIYRIVEGLPEVVDSIVVGRRTSDADEEIVLFVVLRAGVTLDGALTGRIREAIAVGASKRHVPRHVRQVRAIPHTISGKKVELAVQQVLHGQQVQNRDALANPEALDDFVLDA